MESSDDEENCSGEDTDFLQEPDYIRGPRLRFFLNYLSAGQDLKYPVHGVTPFQALLRLAAGALIEELETVTVRKSSLK
jgi:hypothetical protein